MGAWYRVTKRINGRFYDYWQRTTRVGKSVKTENKYIGPTSCAASFSSSAQYERTVSEHRDYLARADYRPPPPEPLEPAYSYDELTAEERREIRALEREQKKQFDAAMKRQAAKVRAAKRKTKGTKSVNPFIAQALMDK